MSASDQEFFKANFALLKLHYPQLWQRFRENPPQPVGEIVFSPQGSPNLLVRNADGKAFTLHQENDPAAEIPQFLKLVPPGSTGFVVFLGMGLGYAPLALLQERPNINRLVILELDEGVFWQALQAMDLAALIKNPRVTLLVGAHPDIAKNLGGFMAALTMESIYTLEHFAVFGLDRDGYRKLKDDFFQFANTMNIGGSTVTAYGKTFVANRFRQLSGIGHDYFLDSLQGAFAGVPAILVAGGPSLNKNIHLLPQAKGLAVIIAVDAAIPPLLVQGVKPDFVGSIDMQPLTYEKYGAHASDLAEVSLVCAPWVTPKVSKYVNVERVFWLFSQNNMEKWLHNRLGGRLTFPGAGTVAQLNLYAAILLGCSPIIFVGQDFAFSDDRSHAENIVLSGQQKVQKMLAAKKELHYVPGTLGGTVATDRSFLSMKKTVEDTIRSNPNTYINATEGGAHIEGARVMPLQEVLAEFCRPGSATVAMRIAEKLGQARPPDMAAVVKEFRATLQRGQVQLKYISQSDELGGRILVDVTKLERRAALFTRFDRLPKELQKRLRKNDELHGKIDRDQIWSLLQDVTTEGLRDTERMKVAIEQLEGDPARYLLWLRKSLERLMEINKVRRRVLADFLAKISQTIENFESEQALLRQDRSSYESSLALARLYMANGDIRLARPVLEEMLSDQHDSAEIHFLLGKIAALQVDFAAADRFFAEAQRLSPLLEAEIDVFRHECAAEYLTFYKDNLTGRKMLLKGLRYDCRHEGVRKQIMVAVAQDLALMSAALAHVNGLQDDPVQAAGSKEAADLARFWHENLRSNPNLAALLTTQQAAAIHFSQGQLLFGQGDFSGALAGYQEAAALTPQDALIQVAIFEAAFNLGRFDLGTTALTRAVDLDHSLARHWEELGDLLLASQQPADALAAYEQCFANQPEQFHLLKKIGDCYLALEQLEAAREAYRFYQQKALAAGANPVE
ncbi:MAG: DUF115 domain-containing protein [Desulfobulbaceae bacterium]|nr:DUF115 domain-containing protein [Desulfobulbaceae bacterium]